MISGSTLVRGRAALLAAVDRNPYARHVISPTDDPTGYLADGVTAWFTHGPHGPAGYALGAARPARNGWYG